MINPTSELFETSKLPVTYFHVRKINYSEAVRSTSQFREDLVNAENLQMEEVLSKFESTGISQNALQTNYESLYKNWGRNDNQEQRRKELLDIQKNNRFNNVDHYRGIMELVNAVEQGEIFKERRKAKYSPSIQVPGFSRVLNKEVLMYSEWMTEKPSDFEENWLVMPCPKGLRSLVVATNGSTKVFTKYGHFMFHCRTALPGGSPYDAKSRSCCCVLDCFYDKNNKTMYVADILAWNSQPMTDGECEFRHFWLKMHLEELQGLSVLNKRNNLIFKILEKTSCNQVLFNELVNTFPIFKPADPGLDGLLFYHKMGNYVSGHTPLAIWLYTYMVPEVLGQDVTVNPAYMLEMPADYTCQADFIKAFNMKNARKSAKIRYPPKYDPSLMDTTELKDDEDTEDSTENNEKPKTESMESEVADDNTQKNGDKESNGVKNAVKTETMESEPVTDVLKSEHMESEAVETT